MKNLGTLATIGSALGLGLATLAFDAAASGFAFRPIEPIAIDGFAKAVAVGDLDGDGRDDIVTSAVRDSTQRILLVQLHGPGGTLASPVEYPGGGYVVELEDVNGDDILDIVQTPAFFGPPSILLGDGTGSFEPVPAQSTQDSDCPDLAILDIDLDGVPDIVCHGNSGSGLIYYGDGAGGVRSTAELPTLSTGRSGGFDLADIEAADVTGDGLEDLVIATYYSPGFYVFAHDGVAGFEQASIHLDPAYDPQRLTGMPYALAIADFDGDGLNDVAVTKYYAPAHATVFHQDPAGGMLAPVRLPGPEAMGSMAATDLDGDGRVDLLAMNTQGVTRYMNSGERLIEGIDSPAPVIDTYTASLATGDINGDGCTDAVGVGAQLTLLPGRCTSLASDFDGDSRSDALWRNASTGGTALWSAADYAAQLPVVGVGNLAWQPAGMGDVDGDGRADLVWRDAATGQNAVWLAGQYADQQPITRVSDVRWEIAAIGDFDGDHFDDLLWRHAATGGNVIWRAADSARQRRLPSVTGTGWVVAGVGDFDGDGVDDVLWRNPANGANTIWRSADATDQDNITDVADTAWDIAGVGDFDADGRDDIAWRHGSTGRNVIWNGGQYGDQAAVRGVTDTRWKIAAIGDYDGDGRDDLFWRHATTGRNVIWVAAKSTDQRSVQGVTDIDWSVVP